MQTYHTSMCDGNMYITVLLDSGFEARHIVTFSGHRYEQVLKTIFMTHLSQRSEAQHDNIFYSTRRSKITPSFRHNQ